MSYLSFGTVLEAMAVKKPLLHYREDELYTHDYPSLYPIKNCNTPMDIHHALCEYQSSPALFENMGQQAHEWFKRHAVDHPINCITQLLPANSLDS